MSQDSTRVELLAIPVIGVVLGVIALVMLAAVEGPWAWIVLGVALLLLLAFAVRYASKRFPHMWDEAPADETLPAPTDDST
jgi:hypothetical protein